MNLKLNYEFKETIKITENMVVRFAELSGDINPIHLDENYAKTTKFGRRIAHGMLTGALISRSLVKGFGNGIIYLGQTLKFTAPIYLEDEISISLKVIEFREDKKIATIETVVAKLTGETAVTGEAKILV